jgi:hypothetical protein
MLKTVSFVDLNKGGWGGNAAGLRNFGKGLHYCSFHGIISMQLIEKGFSGVSTLQLPQSLFSEEQCHQL